MHFEVAYAHADIQVLLPVESDSVLTVEEAIHLSGVLTRFPELVLTSNPVGIFGHVVSLSTCLKDGDRVEIYRPLKVDPKELRRRRAISIATRKPVRKKIP